METKPTFKVIIAGGREFRDETHILAGGNRWAYIEDILPDECDKASVVRLTVLLNKTK